MNSVQSTNKFEVHQQRIEHLQKNNLRFSRIYSEYKSIMQDLWNVENLSKNISIPDDFVLAMMLQLSYLEEEIEHWLADNA